jgi:hypothetical protein
MNDLDLTETAEAAAPREVVLPEYETAAAPPAAGEVVLPEAEDEDDEGLPGQAEVLADGRVKLPLRYPVTMTVRIGHAAGQSRTFEALLLRRLNGEDRMFAAGKPPEQQLMALSSRSAGMRLDLFNALYQQMDGADTMALDRVVGHFLGLGQKTGRKS